MEQGVSILQFLCTLDEQVFQSFLVWKISVFMGYAPFKEMSPSVNMFISGSWRSLSQAIIQNIFVETYEQAVTPILNIS